MTSIHDQAMNHVYQQVLQRLLSFFSRAERTALQLVIQRLVLAAGGMERLGEYKVLTVQNGSRDSCYTLALLRAAQLSIAGRAPVTFQLRVASLRMNGTSQTARENAQRTYAALFVHDDPRVEVIAVDNRQVVQGDPLAQISEAGREANRLNTLMVGHRRVWDGPVDIWDDYYLATGEFLGQITRWKGGVDALICSDDLRRQNRYITGVRRAAAKVGVRISAHEEEGFQQLFPVLDELGSDCYRTLYTRHEQAPWRPEDAFEACRRASCIDIEDMLASNLEERWPLLTEFLGYQPDELSAHLSDNECVSPLISAHVRGLHACFVQGQSYESGVTGYLQRCLVLMRRRQLPERLCDQAMDALGNPSKAAERRAQGAAEALKHLGLSEAQLVCLLFAPFNERGASLERFLRQCHPGMLVAMPELHRAMQGNPVADQIQQWMVDVSGLSLALIRTLYHMGPAPETHAGGAELTTVDSANAGPGTRSVLTGEWSAGR